LYGLAIKSPEELMDPELRQLRGWSFDRLEWEVTGNIAYRRFCRIDGEKVPDALLVPSVEKHIEVFGKAPALAATDRGFYSTAGEARIRASSA
jgi:hypothetical protein